MAALNDVAQELAALLRRIKGLHTEVTAVADVRVELPAFAVLVLLEDSGDQRPSALAEALTLDLSTISRQLGALERDGHIARHRDPHDQRAQIVSLTDSGREVLSLIRATRLERLAARLPDWTEPELAAFAAQLTRFTTDISQPHPDCRKTPMNRPLALAIVGQEDS